MKSSFLKNLKSLSYSCLFWIIAFVFYYVFRKVGIEAEIGIEINDPLSATDNIALSIVIGILTGVLYFFLEKLFERTLIQRQSLGIQFLIRTTCYLLLINFLIDITLFIQSVFIENNPSYSLFEIWSSPALWPFILFFMLASDLFYFIKLVSQKFGEGVLPKMLMGKYRKPSIENKIFLFIDLKSSTTLAERLGYLKYSELIQQCFYDLNEVVQKFNGGIYQYVGDEAVICWDYKNGIRNNTCVECFFSFTEKLASKEEYYISTFGALPTFKAGLHGGELVVTEVGIIKREIAYHGDVINTTARIQEQCNNFNSRLLISDKIECDLQKKDHLSIYFKGEIPLKGKKLPVGIYDVKKTEIGS